MTPLRQVWRQLPLGSGRATKGRPLRSPEVQQASSTGAGVDDFSQQRALGLSSPGLTMVHYLHCFC
jgi:hypothetical protein